MGSRLTRVAIGALLASSVARGAEAQPAPPDPAPAPAPPAPAPAPSDPAAASPPEDVERRDDPAWQLYHQAFAALARDDRAAARAVTAELRLHHPEHPATARAGLAVDAPAAPSRRGARERPDQGARAELALFQTMYGVTAGIELCVTFECDSGEAYIGMGLVGGAAGAIASLRAHPTPGQRGLYNSGFAWGTFNAAMLLGATEADDAQTIGLGLLGGQAAGLGLGYLLSTKAPTAGQVALANSGGQWSLALTGLTIVAFDVELTDRELFTTLALAGDAGIAAGAYLGWRMPRISRAQTLVIDAAGIVGAVTGGAAGVLVTGEADRTTAGLAAIGAVLGLGAAGYLTRNWGDDDDGPALRTSIVPARGGGLLSANLAW